MCRNLRLAMSVVFLFWELLVANSWAEGPSLSRFFYSGDGHINLFSEKSGAAFKGRYRTGPGCFDRAALEAISLVFNSPTVPEMELSLRLIAFLDFLEDKLRPGARITIVSGYRDPEYNTSLIQKGFLAAKGSLHQYGMAADIKIEGVSPQRLWNFIKTLKFGGAGYYHGDIVHVDVGPARSWDERTSGVGTGISDDNKLIALWTDFDRYLPGETMVLRFIRMTAFPIGVARKFRLEAEGMSEKDEPLATFEPIFPVTVEEACPRFTDIAQMSFIRCGLPNNLPSGRYILRAQFCDNEWKDMPPQVVTPVFAVIADEKP